MSVNVALSGILVHRKADAIEEYNRVESEQTLSPAGASRKSGAYVVAGILGIMVCLAAWYYYVGTRKIPSAGGLYYFSNLVLPVQRFAQNDPRWADDELGPASSTMGEEGCAVSSAAMVLAFYGQDIDPGRLNAFLSNSGGYTPQGWLYWERAADFQPGLARHAYEDLPSYFLIDSNLARGNPVIVRVHLPEWHHALRRCRWESRF